MDLLRLVDLVPLELQVFFISLVPLLELRVAIPYGMARGLDPAVAVTWGTLGNVAQVPFVAALVWAAHRYAARYVPRAKPLLDWADRRAMRSRRLIQKYGFPGLALFVALPFPGSGIWSASVLGSLFGMGYWGTVLSICVGVVIAGVLVGLAATGALGIIRFVQ